MSETKTYTGSCHCGNVKYEAETDLASVMQCNCSICRRNGWLLTFVPATKFQLRSGADAQRDYQFGKKHLHHLFCTNCGVRTFSRGTGRDGADMVALNVRCLDGVDPASLKITQYDGASH